MHAVAVEIGVEARGDRDAQTARRADSRPAKRPFGNDMHQVRLAAAPFSMQPPAGRQAETQAGIAGQRQARQGQFVLVAGIGLALARADNAHAVATFTQAADQAPHRHGDTVDLGWKGFSDESDIERGRGVHEVSCCNDRLIGHRYSRMTVFFTRLSSQRAGDSRADEGPTGSCRPPKPGSAANQTAALSGFSAMNTGRASLR